MGALKISSDDAPQTVMVYLKDIKVLPDLLQTRAETNPKIVSIYSKRMKQTDFEPILVYRLPDGKLVLADGFHRIAAAKMLRREKIASTIVEGTMEEAILAGLAANKALEDRSLTDEDKFHAAKVMIRNKEFNSWCNSEIGKRCGVGGSTTLPRLRVQMEKEEGIPLPDKVKTFTKDGRWLGRMLKYHHSLPKLGVGNLKRRTNRNADAEQFYARIDGRFTSLGSSEATAENRIRDLAECRAETNSHLSQPSNFRKWLAYRDIHCGCVASETIGCVLVADSAAYPVTDDLANLIFEAIGRLVAAKSISSISRLIMVGYLCRVAAKICNEVASLGIEVMTPEEFVAEFAPKPDTPPGDDSPTDSDDGKPTNGQPSHAAIVQQIQDAVKNLSESGEVS